MKVQFSKEWTAYHNRATATAVHLHLKEEGHSLRTLMFMEMVWGKNKWGHLHLLWTTITEQRWHPMIPAISHLQYSAALRSNHRQSNPPHSHLDPCDLKNHKETQCQRGFTPWSDRMVMVHTLIHTLAPWGLTRLQSVSVTHRITSTGTSSAMIRHRFIELKKLLGWEVLSHIMCTNLTVQYTNGRTINT